MEHPETSLYCVEMNVLLTSRYLIRAATQAMPFVLFISAEKGKETVNHKAVYQEEIWYKFPNGKLIQYLNDTDVNFLHP